MRRIVAERVKGATHRASVSALLQAHLAAARDGLPHGCAGARLLGRDTAVLVLDALKVELAKRHPRRIEGGAVDFCAALGIRVKVDAASAAMRLVSAATPILRREGRYCWSADLATLKTARHGDMHIAAVLEWPPQNGPGCQRDPASDPARGGHDSDSGLTGSRRPAGAVVLVQNSAAERQIFALEQDPGLGCASPAPAEQDSTRPDAPAASASDAPLTSSAWIQAVPRHHRQQQAAALLRNYPLEHRSRDPIEAAKDLLRQRDSTEWQGRPAGHREVAAVARGLQGLQRRGLVGADFTPPRPARHPWLAVLGVRERPGADRPSSKQAAYLRRCGIDPAGLSRAEARALGGALAKRREAVMAHPRMLARLIESYGWADRLAEACAAGVIEVGLAGTLEWLRGLSMSAMLGLSRRGRMQ